MEKKQEKKQYYLQPDTVLTACSDGRILCHDLRGGSSSESMLAGILEQIHNCLVERLILKLFSGNFFAGILEQIHNCLVERLILYFGNFLRVYSLNKFTIVRLRVWLSKQSTHCLQAAAMLFMRSTSTLSNLTLSPPATIRSASG